MRFANFLIYVVIAASPVTFFAQSYDDKTVAVKAYQAGDYGQAAKLFRKVTSKNPGDAEAWVLLGNSYFNLGKVADSIDPYEKAIQIAPKNETYRLNLATAYLIWRDPRAELIAESVLEANPRNASASFILGSLAYFRDDYDKARGFAVSATRDDPAFADAYRLLYISLIATFPTAEIRIVASDTRVGTLKKAVEAFEKYYSLAPPDLKKEIETEVNDLKFFVGYYSGLDLNRSSSVGRDPSTDSASTPLKIIRKNPPNCNENTRSRQTEGKVLLLVRFQADGKVGPIMLLRSADRDLDQCAMAAARTIRFEPPTNRGVPVAAVKRVEYTFSLY